MSNICTAKYLAFVARVGKSSGLNSFGLMWCNGLLFGPILLFWTFIKGDLELTMNFPYLFFPGFQTQEVRLRLNVDVAVPSKSSPAPPPIESFTDMDIAFHEYSTTTSIQAQAMPVALSGKDLLGCAETGSGKTAAFAIPMIQHCLDQPPVCRGDGPLALVLAPTRELAQQIEKERSELRAGVNIVVATPGRFIDHLQQGNTSLSRVSYVVLDEADRMLDMEFEPQIKEVMRNLPEKHQTLLFSATMPVEIESLAQEYLTDPVRVKVGKVSSPAANVAQFLVKVSDNEKKGHTVSLNV